MGRPLGPSFCAHLLQPVDDCLVELLEALPENAWEMPTIVRGWRVKDIAAHLLDTQTRKLASLASNHASNAADAADEAANRISGQDADREGAAKAARGEALAADAELIAFINRLNAAGVRRYRGLATRELIARLRAAARRSAALHTALDPFAPARHAVSWAGEAESANWFDTARELSERWHHQQHIRLAVSGEAAIPASLLNPGIMTPALYHPVLDCFMRALPHAYRNQPAPPETVVTMEITGECGGNWELQRGELQRGELQRGELQHGELQRGELQHGELQRGRESWRLIEPEGGPAAVRVSLPQEHAWRLFTKGMAREEALRVAMIEGRRELALPALAAIAIVG